jgi:hypothetical protein
MDTADTAIIVKVILGFAFLLCPVCGIVRKFFIHESDPRREDFQCEGCNVIQKFKVRF